MIRTSRRTAGRSRVAVAALAAAGATLLAGCHAGQQAQTAEQIPTIDGNYAQVGDLALRDVKIEYPETGSWRQGGDARVEMVVVNQARASDALVSVRSEVADGAELSPAAGGATPSAGASEPSGSPTGTDSATGTATPSESPSETASPSGSGSPSESPSGSESASPSASPSPTPTEETPASITIPGVSLVSFKGEGPEIVLTGLTRLLRPGQVVPVTFVFQEAGEVTVNVAVAIPIEEIEPAPTVPAEGEAEAGAEVEE